MLREELNHNVILRINQLHKSVGKKQILSNITFDVHEGELFGLLGPNGSGKTTIIRSVLGLVKKSSGKIFINHHDLDKNFKEAIRSVGAIVENPEFYDYLTGFQNLKIFSLMYEKVPVERIDEVVDLVHLGENIHRKVGTYSLGMRQRLGIAQALLHHPKLLLLDEPTNGLDPSGINELRGHLRTISKKEKVAIVIATHLLKEIEDICDRVAIIQNGELVYVNDVKKDQSDLQSHVNFEVDDHTKAYEVIQNAGFQLTRDTIDDSLLKVNATKQKIPEINRLLVQNDISVFEIKVSSKSLEEAFLEITTGERK